MKRAWILALALPASLQAAGNPDFSLRSGARSLAMGEVAAAADQGLESLAWNPAGLAGQKDVQATLGHTDWVGLSAEQLFVAAPLGSGTLGLGGFYDSTPDLVQRDTTGQATGSLSYRNLGGALAWGQSLGSLALGLEAGGWQVSNAGIAQSGLQVDAGAQYHLGSVVLGAAGFQVESEASWQGSILWSVFQGSNSLRLGGGYISEGIDSRWGIGAELGFLNSLSLRAGWQVGNQASVIQGLTGPTAGLGVQWGAFGLDYAWMPLGELGQVQRGQLSWKFQGLHSTVGSSESPAASASTTSVPAPASSKIDAVPAKSEPEAPKKEVKLKFVVPAE